MNKWMKAAALGVAVTFVVAPAGMAAKAKKPVKKPAAKNTTAPHVVQGTTQLSGENAQFGTVYTLGKESPFNITLKSAEYTVGHVKIGENVYIPTADEKLLLLHFTYHNPRPSEYFIRWDSFGFTIVDPQSENHDGLQELGMEKDSSTCSMTFKPAQKVEVYGVMRVPAKGEMPKLIIKSNDDNLVLRYDLRGKVKGLTAPYADPADSAGATALATIAAKSGTTYPVGMFDFKFDSAEYNSASTMGEATLDEGERFFVAKFSLKNVDTKDAYFRWDSFATKLVDSDGVEVATAYDVYQASKDRSYGANTKPGQELTLRYIFKVPNDTDLKTFSVAWPENGRIYEFDISGVK